MIKIELTLEQLKELEKMLITMENNSILDEIRKIITKKIDEKEL